MRGIRTGLVAAGLLALFGPGQARAQVVAFQPVVGSFPDGVALNAVPVVSADRRYVRLTSSPQFTSLIGLDTATVAGAVGGGGPGGGGFGGLGGGLGGGIAVGPGFGGVGTGFAGPMAGFGPYAGYGQGYYGTPYGYGYPPAPRRRPRPAVSAGPPMTVNGMGFLSGAIRNTAGRRRGR